MKQKKIVINVKNVQQHIGLMLDLALAVTNLQMWSVAITVKKTAVYLD